MKPHAESDCAKPPALVWDDAVAVGHAQTFIVAPPAPGPSTHHLGRGLAEAEAEVEAEVGNGSAAVACVAAGGGGAVGLAATGRVAAATSASTTACNQTAVQPSNHPSHTYAYGPEVRANDVVRVMVKRELDRPAKFSLPAKGAAEATAEASAPDGKHPSVTLSPPPTADGDARAILTDSLVGTLRPNVPDPAPDLVHDVTVRQRTRVEHGGRPPNGHGLLVANPDGNLEIEIEAEAEVGFTSAAAGAAAVAVQAGNGLVVRPAEAVAATSASTSVLGSQENWKGDHHRPGPAQPGQRGGVPVPDVDLTRAVFEAEVEAEAEAEVGYYAGAAAAGAASAGIPPTASGPLSKVSARAVATPYAAAAAAAAGRRAYTFVCVPPAPADGSVPTGTGTILAYAHACDPNGGPVSIALAVAGVPLQETRVINGRTVTIGVDHGREFEKTAVGAEAGIYCSLRIQFSYDDLATDRYLEHTDTDDVAATELDGPDLRSRMRARPRLATASPPPRSASRRPGSSRTSRLPAKRRRQLRPTGSTTTASTAASP